MDVPTAPGFTPIHSFVGGLMLASGVHAMLREVGMVLGISGFFHTTVRDMVLGSETTSTKAASLRRTPTDPQRIRHRISPEDDAIKQSDEANAYTSRLFVHGLLAGGALLAAARSPLERALGSAIYDPVGVDFHIGKGLSAGIFSIEAAKRFIPVAFWGLLVGLGTKLGSGCTSGHFLCGLSRFSWRSFVATCTFFSVAVVTNLIANPTVPLSKKALAQSAPDMPSLSAVAVLQLPALLYLFVIPSLVARRINRKGVTPSEAKVVHEQATRASSFLIGMHFALGLALTGMTRPSKVLGFLNLSPARIHSRHWDPSLAFVALGGIVPSSLSYFLTIKRRVDAHRAGQQDVDAKPLYWHASPRWRLPTSSSIDLRLIFGAVLFGIGWGVTGLCPGPAIVGFGASTLPAPQDRDALVHLASRGTFVGAVALGGLLISMLS